MALVLVYSTLVLFAQAAELQNKTHQLEASHQLPESPHPDSTNCTVWRCMGKIIAQYLVLLKDQVESIKSQVAQQQEQVNKLQTQFLTQPNQQQDRQIQEDCSNYKTLNDSGRNVYNTVDEWNAKQDRIGATNKEPQWEGSGRYRFDGPFTRMAVQGEVNRTHQCGTVSPGYIVDPQAHNIKVGEVKEYVRVCFVGLNNSSCAFNTIVTITKCQGNFFVYRLPDISSGVPANTWGGYCGAKYSIIDRFK